MIRVSGLFRYAIKSTRGESLETVEVGPMGLADDRCWMVADAAGSMITGRSEPRLVLVEARREGSNLTLAAPGCADLVVPLAAFGEAAPAAVWRARFAAFAGAAAADAWLSAFLGRSVRLLYIGQSSARRVETRPDKTLSFADGFPLLLIGEASLAELNRRLVANDRPPVDMRRFRPNLVVAGDVPFAEDDWVTLRIGDVVFSVMKPCERCVFTTVDPDSGSKSPIQEPLRTLASFRNTADGVLFGQNVVAEGSGRLTVGMTVEIVARQ